MAEQSNNKKQNIENLKKEIHLLSFNLKKLGTKKEKQYREKIQLEKTLNQLIKSAKDLRDKKTSTDKDIKHLKKSREEYNNEVRKIAQQIKNLTNKKKEFLRREGAFANRLNKKIKYLEYKIQTEVINFKKEKQYMDEIKRLKSQLNEFKKKESQFKDLDQLTKRITIKKKDADQLHKKIQNLAKESSDIFNDLTKKSKEIAEIKAKRSAIQNVLKSIKLQIGQMNQRLSDILKDWSSVADTIVLTPARKGLKLIHKKAEEVKDKLKSKKKLTKDDILAIQREAINNK